MTRICNFVRQSGCKLVFVAWWSITLISSAPGVVQQSVAQVTPSPFVPLSQPDAVPSRIVAPLAEATLTFGGLRYVGFSPDGKTVSAGSTQGDFQQLGAADLAPVEASEGLPPLGVASSAITRDHQLIAIGGWSGDIILFDPRSEQITAQLPVPFDLDRTAVTALAVTEDASKCVAGNRSSVVRMYRVASSELLWESAPLDQEISGVTVSKDGKHVAVSTGVLKDFRAPGKIVTLDGATGKVRHTWLDTTAKVNHVAIAADSKTLLAADNSALRLYDLVSGQLLHTNPALSGIQRFKFIDDTRCAISLFPGRLVIWDMASKQIVVRYTGHKRGADASVAQLVWALDVSPDGKKLVTADSLGQIYLWPVPAK